MLGIIIAAAVILGVIALIGARDRKSAHEKAVAQFRSEFGSVRDQTYPDGRYEKICRYYERHRQGPVIDDITWNDLDMDAIYARMDRTCSAAGEEYLYYMLRCANADTRRIPSPETLQWWTGNEEERIRVQLALQALGTTGKYSLYDYLDLLDDLEDRPLSRDLPAVVLPAAAFAVMFVRVPLGLILLLAVLAINMVTYFRDKAKIDPYLQTFRYVLRLIRSAQSLSSMEMPPACGGTKEEMANAASALSSFARGSGLLMRSANSASGNPAGLLIDYLCILFHLDLMVYGKMLREIRGHAGEIDSLITAAGAVDAQISIASFAASLPYYAVPQYYDGDLTAEKIYHPLLENPVPSDLSVKGPVLITGSNASGKSTFLKTVALCALLGQAAGVVPASSYRARRYRIYTSMALRDDLKSGESYFLVEIRSLKRVLDAAASEENGTVLCCVDEVLRGTNTLERISASTEILSALAEEGVQVFAATHDLELTSLLNEQYENYHFSEELDGDDIRFRYQLLPGPADSRNAIRLLKMLGYDEGIVQRAQRRAENFTQTGEWK